MILLKCLLYRVPNRTIIMPTVLHGYNTWSLNLRKEHNLKVFENEGLRRIVELRQRM
jgi:hypothetical protein